jgi:hypothetical protein
MNNFEFISHESFPEDNFIKEVVLLEFQLFTKNEQGRDVLIPFAMPMARKPNSQTGGLYWDFLFISPKKNGKGVAFRAKTDSEKFNRRVIQYLENREWEKGKSAQPQNIQSSQPLPTYGDNFVKQEEALTQGEIPF